MFLTILDEILTGRIVNGDAGHVDGLINGHLSDTVAGITANGRDGHIEGPVTGVLEEEEVFV